MYLLDQRCDGRTHRRGRLCNQGARSPPDEGVVPKKLKAATISLIFPGSYALSKQSFLCRHPQGQ